MGLQNACSAPLHGNLNARTARQFAESTDIPGDMDLSQTTTTESIDEKHRACAADSPDPAGACARPPITERIMRRTQDSDAQTASRRQTYSGVSFLPMGTTVSRRPHPPSGRWAEVFPALDIPPLRSRHFFGMRSAKKTPLVSMGVPNEAQNMI